MSPIHVIACCHDAANRFIQDNPQTFSERKAIYVSSRSFFYTTALLDVALAPCARQYRDWDYARERIAEGSYQVLIGNELLNDVSV